MHNFIDSSARPKRDTSPRYTWKALLLVLFTAYCDIINGNVEVYPGPGESVRQSSMYQVNVVQYGVTYESFVYEIHAQKIETWRHNVCSFTTFSFTDPVIVEVTKLGGAPIQSCRIYPSSYTIAAEVVSARKVRFTVREPMKKMAVIFNDDWITHPLLIFADPPETKLPRAGDANVIYFGPGVHNAGIIRPRTGQTVYLAGGAYVKGAIDTRGQGNVVILGRGILSQEDMAFHEAHAIDMGWSSSHRLVEGITIIQLAFFGIAAQGADTDIRNVKIVGCWRFNNDGVDAPSGGEVEDCFFKCNDDAIKLNFANTIVRRNVIWQMENGAVFQISWNMPNDNSNFHIYDCDVIRTEHRWDNTNLGIIVAHHSGAGHMSGYLFEDIRVENAQNRLFNIHLFRDPQYYNISAGNGEVSDIIIRNFKATNCNLQRPEIIAGLKGNPARPADAGVTYYVHDVTFEDLQINGALVTDAKSGNFNIDPDTTYNIKFKTSPVVPARLEAEEMSWDDDQKVIISEEDPNEVRILEKDARIGSSIFVPSDTNELTFKVRARAVFNKQGRLAAYPKMTLFLDNKDAGQWQIESVIEQGRIQSAYQDYSAVSPVNEGIHRVELAMTYEPPNWDWDLIVDYVDVNTPFTPGPSVEDFETGGFDRFNWVSLGDADWTVTSDEHKSGSYSARAGSIGDNGSTTLELTLGCLSGQISFFYKVSCEQDYDYLRFYIDGTQQGEWSGDEGWTEVSFPVKAGRRTFRWEYSKDGSSSDGDDTAWIDDITFP